MLVVSELEKALTRSLEEVLPSALEEGFKHVLPCTSKAGNEKAKEFGESITKMIAEPLGIRFSNAIDYYIKNADIYGQIKTIGSSASQIATIESPSPLINGKVPNTFGIK